MKRMIYSFVLSFSALINLESREHVLSPHDFTTNLYMSGSTVTAMTIENSSVFCCTARADHYINNGLFNDSQTEKTQPSFIHRNPAPQPLTVRILSMDGGGVRGIVMAYFLMRLEERVHKPIHKLFHYVAGTSAGGILATALSLPDPVNPSQAQFTGRSLTEMLTKEASHIFNRRMLSFLGFTGPKYHGPHPVFQRVVGDALFENGLMRAMVTTYDLESRRIKAITNYPSRDCAMNGLPLEIFKASDAITATSAAPTYFDPHVCSPAKNAYQDKYILGDGGIGVNNPSSLILQDVLRTYPGANIVFVSLGTGVKTTTIKGENLIGAGKVKWLKSGLVDMLMGAPNELVADEMRNSFIPYYQEDGAYKSIVQGAYYRFNPSIANDEMDNIDSKNLRSLTKAMQSEIERNGSMWHHLVKVLDENPLIELPSLGANQKKLFSLA